MAIPVKLQVFEGPLDLLLHLIDKNKIDIYDIPISEVTDQYLAYVREMDTEDMDVTSEFLVMAATLLDIKSRMLLPKDPETEEEEEDPREELVRRLLEYKMFKYMAGELKDRSITAGQSMYREQALPPEVEDYTPPVDYESLLGSATLDRLKTLFRESLKRSRDRRDPVRSGFGKIRREQMSISDKELYVEAWLQSHPRTDFAELLEKQGSREEIIVTFLVILELIKKAKVRVRQEGIFGKIFIEAVSKKGEEHADIKPAAEPEYVDAGTDSMEDTDMESDSFSGKRGPLPSRTALLAVHTRQPDKEIARETEVWNEKEQHPLSNRSCSSWVKRWKYHGLQRHSRSRRRKSGMPRRYWKKNMRRRRADWL